MEIKTCYYLNEHVDSVFSLINVDEETVKKPIDNLATKMVVVVMVFFQNF